MADLKKLVVLGANSFSGQDFVDLVLESADRHVIGVSRSKERSKLFLKYKERTDLSHYRYEQIDMNKNMDALLNLLDKEKPQEIINFAAQSEVAPSWEHPEHWFETNTVALARLVNHLRKKSYLKRYVHISSPEVYGNCIGTINESAPVKPSTPYAASKAAADLLLSTYQKQYGFPALWIRATNVYGSRQQLFKIIPRTAIYIKLGKKIQLHGGGVAVKSYIHIRDVSRGELVVLEKGTIGKLYHLSPDRGVSVADVIKMICLKMNKSFDQTVQPVEERPGQDAAYVIDSSLARSSFGWKPAISLEQGIEDVILWVEKYWDQIKEESLDYQHKE